MKNIKLKRGIVYLKTKNKIEEYGEYGIWDHKKLPAPKIRMN